jgi:hypothetical protein
MHVDRLFSQLELMTIECYRTEVASDCVDVLPVDGAVDGVRVPVAVGQQRRCVVGDAGEAQEDEGTHHPPQLRHRPRQRQHAGAHHRRHDVRRRRPHRP